MGIAKTSIRHLSKDQIALIGIPFDAHASFLQGPAKAPELIIEAIESDSANYFTESLNDLNEHPRIAWCGNADLEDYFSISQPIQAILKKGAIPIIPSGSDSWLSKSMMVQPVYSVDKSFHK